MSLSWFLFLCIRPYFRFYSQILESSEDLESSEGENLKQNKRFQILEAVLKEELNGLKEKKREGSQILPLEGKRLVERRLQQGQRIRVETALVIRGKKQAIKISAMPDLLWGSIFAVSKEVALADL